MHLAAGDALAAVRHRAVSWSTKGKNLPVYGQWMKQSIMLCEVSSSVKFYF
jgi:hypothetical protein